MRILLDTHALLWAAKGTLSDSARSLLEDTTNELYFSSVNLWEIELKRSRLEFDPKMLYQNLLHNGYQELKVSSRHVLGLPLIPSFHNDPFDRMLLAQALTEQIYLLTADSLIKQYCAQLDCIIGFD